MRVAGVGYLLRPRVLEVPAFVHALERVVAGGTALDPEVVAAMMTRTRRDRDPLDRLRGPGPDRGGEDRSGHQPAVLDLGACRRRAASAIYDTLGLTLDGDDHPRVPAAIRYLSR